MQTQALKMRNIRLPLVNDFNKNILKKREWIKPENESVF